MEGRQIRLVTPPYGALAVRRLPSNRGLLQSGKRIFSRGSIPLFLCCCFGCWFRQMQTLMQRIYTTLTTSLLKVHPTGRPSC
jgi:hypothetical protein